MPVVAAERLHAVDVLRGVALLGILAMNIVYFGWPLGGYENPLFSGGNHVPNTIAWAVNSVVFSGQRSWTFYRRLALLGYGLGVPLTVVGMWSIYLRDFAPLQAPVGVMLFGLGMVPTALGHAAVVMMVCKSGRAVWLTRPLAAVGRMALTNYLMQSVIGTVLFYGYGAGLSGRVDRVGLWGIVLGVWLLQLVISPLWLKHFRYGPAEWLWRSLTYWQRQPMRNLKTA